MALPQVCGEMPGGASKHPGIRLTSFPHELIKLATRAAICVRGGFKDFRTERLIASANLNVAPRLVVREVDLVALAGLRIEIKKNRAWGAPADACMLEGD